MYFLTDNDAAADTEAERHAEASCLVSSLYHGNHVLEVPREVKRVDQPLDEKETRG